MTTMTKEQAFALMDRVDALIKQAKLIEKTDDMGTVNWGDICARDVIEEYSHRDGEKSVCIFISEAEPHCKLTQWIAGQLGDSAVYVRAEW